MQLEFRAGRSIRWQARDRNASSVLRYLSVDRAREHSLVIGRDEFSNYTEEQ